MRNKTNEEIKAERERAIEEVKKQYGDDIEVLESFFENAPHEACPLWYLAKSIELLSKADLAYFANGWEDARGCAIEHQCASSYGIKTIYSI